MFDNDYVKIYNGTPSHKKEYTEDELAERYLEHKQLGNTAKTKELGEKLSGCLIEAAKRFSTDEYLRQKLTLIAFVMCDVLEELITDEILQKSALASFKQSLATKNTEVSEIITDSAAFTLYMLDVRRTASDSGKIYAELCGGDNYDELSGDGSQLDGEYRKIFYELISNYTFNQ